MENSKNSHENQDRDEFNDSSWVSENRYLALPEKSLIQLVVCPIIPHILQEPVCCSKCETHFCKKCIGKAMEKDSRCPVCRQEMTIGQAQKTMNNLLDNLLVRCINFERGCDESISYSSHKYHLEECGYEYVACDRFRCAKNILRKDIENHKKECDTELIPCDFCLLEFNRGELKSHLNNTICTETCQWCKIKLFRPALPAHEKTCDQIPILCLRCGGSFFRQSYEAHREECRNRYNIGGKLKGSEQTTICSPLISNNTIPSRATKNLNNELSPAPMVSSNNCYSNLNYGKNSYVNLGSSSQNINTARQNIPQFPQNLLAPSNICNMSLNHQVPSPSQTRPGSNQNTPMKVQVSQQQDINHSRKNLIPPQYPNYPQQLISSPRKQLGALGMGSPLQNAGSPQIFMGSRR